MRRPFGVCGKIPALLVCLYGILKDKKRVTHIIRPCISQHVVQRVLLGHVLGGLPNDDHKFNFVVWEVIFWGLRNAGNDDIVGGPDERCYGLEEEDRGAEQTRTFGYGLGMRGGKKGRTLVLGGLLPSARNERMHETCRN